MSTLSDIAKAAGVSTGVVSRVVNGDTTLRISKDTRDRVLKAIEDLDYTPNVAARSLRSARSAVLAFVVHDVSNSVYREILDGAQSAAAEAGKSLVLADASSSHQSPAGLLRLINGGGLDGLVIQGSGEDADEIIARAARRNMPIVALQARLTTKAHLLRVNDYEAARIAAEHLHELGHREIGCIATGEGLSFTNERLRGIKAIYPGFSDKNIRHSDPDVEAGALATAALLGDRPQLTALICLNVLGAVGALRTMRRLSLDVPTDLSIVAVHDLALAQDLATPLTTVQTPLFELGKIAIELVLSEGLEPRAETIIEKSPELILRKSTAPPS